MADHAPGSSELPRNLLLVLCIIALTAGCFWVLRPFITALITGTTIVIATWPILGALERRLGGRRGLAIALMMTCVSLAFLLPLCIGVIATVQNMDAMVTWVHTLPQRTLSPLPEWLAGLPLAGPRLNEAWSQLGEEGLKARLAGHAADILRWLMSRLGNLAGMLVQVLITLAIAGGLYSRGEGVSAFLLGFARRLAGDEGEQAARLAARATRGVALGVVLTPVVQAILAGIGMVIAGVPHAGLIAALVLVSCLAQAGPVPAMLIAVGLLFARGATVPAVGVLVWAVLIHASGPILRPLLIKQGVDMPFTMILFGVIGGVAAFGVVGLFMGPVLLAVGLTLLQRWVATGKTGAPGTAGSATPIRS